MNIQFRSIIEEIESKIEKPTQDNIKLALEEIICNDGWSLLKDEYENMNRDQKRELYKSIKNNINTECPFTEEELLEREMENENLNIQLNTDIEKEEIEQTECQQLIDEEVTELNERKDVLRKELGEIQTRLRELTGKSVSKIEICRQIYIANPDLKRKQYLELFMDEANTTPAGSSTYLATIKKEMVVE